MSFLPPPEKTPLQLDQQLAVAQWEHLKDLLRSSNHPQSTDGRQIPQLLREAERDYERCADEIALCHVAIIARQNHQQNLRSQIQGYRSLLSPLRKLPTELIRSILGHFCQDPIIIGRDSGRFWVPAMIMGQVCAHWRTISLTSPELWSSISLDADRIAENQLSLVELLLSRSGNKPLTIAYKRLDGGEQCFDLFIPHMSRCTNLSIEIDATDIENWHPIAKLKGKLDKLHTLTLMQYYQDSDDEGLQVFGMVPNLRSVSLGRMVSPSSVALPWRQLHHLELGEHTTNDCAKTLARCLKLEHLSLDRCDLDEDPDDEWQNVCSAIRSLTVQTAPGDAYIDQFSMLFPFLTLPSLATLRIASAQDGLTDETGFAFPQFEKLLSRSACNITTFTWDAGHTTEAEWLDIIQAMPSLVELNVVQRLAEDLPITPNFLKKLCSHFSFNTINTFILPRLERLSMKGLKNQGIDQPFVHMVKSRLGAGHNSSALKRVSLEVVERKFTEQYILPLKYLNKAGMQIYVRDSTGVVVF